jgi:hypothetical protein
LATAARTVLETVQMRWTCNTQNSPLLACSKSSHE